VELPQVVGKKITHLDLSSKAESRMRCIFMNGLRGVGTASFRGDACMRPSSVRASGCMRPSSIGERLEIFKTRPSSANFVPVRYSEWLM